MSECILKIEKLSKIYSTSSEKLIILNELDAEIQKGTKVIITGESGCGKSTLLNIIGGLDTLSSGNIQVGNYNISHMDEDQLTEYRSQFLGLIFQFHYLLKDFSSLENVFMPAYMAGMKKKEAIERAKQLLNDVGMSHRINHLPAQLSGGERQRVSVARALMNDPMLILADEPTGNLDPDNALMISDLLFSIVDSYKKTLLLVTHDKEIAKKGDVCYKLLKGQLVRV